MKESAKQFYDKHYKKMLLVPLLLIILALVSIGHTYYTTGDFIHKDISLTGGTTITLFSNSSSLNLQKALSSQISDLEVRSLSDSTGKQTQLIVLTSDTPEKTIPILENYLGYKLAGDNYSVEFTSSSLGQGFYTQLLVAVLVAFFLMAAVVFVIFADSWKVKALSIVLTLLLVVFLGKFFLFINLYVAVIILLIFTIALIYTYVKYSIPAFAVMSCAFADIAMTLAVVDLLGMKLSGAGIVAFLMLIGYSVDTDILLTTRVLKRKNTSVNSEIYGAFKTGMTMTLTAIAAVAIALIFVYSFQTALNQIFIILLIGLIFDIFNTWVTNTSLIKWFVEGKK